MYMFPLSGSLREQEMLGELTQATGECFRSFFEFSQTCTRVSITRYKKHGEHVFHFFKCHYQGKLN